jgi:hypothetical protein
MRMTVLCLLAIALLAPGLPNARKSADYATTAKSKVLVSDGSPVPWPTTIPGKLSQGTLLADGSPVPWPTGGSGGHVSVA